VAEITATATAMVGALATGMDVAPAAAVETAADETGPHETVPVETVGDHEMASGALGVPEPRDVPMGAATVVPVIGIPHEAATVPTGAAPAATVNVRLAAPRPTNRRG